MPGPRRRERVNRAPWTRSHLHISTRMHTHRIAHWRTGALAHTGTESRGGTRKFIYTYKRARGLGASEPLGENTGPQPQPQPQLPSPNLLAPLLRGSHFFDILLWPLALSKCILFPPRAESECGAVGVWWVVWWRLVGWLGE
jgi:hypothetical protein